MWLSQMRTFPVVCAAISLSWAASIQAHAMDFLEKQECTIGRPSRAPVHTQCVIWGGISSGRIDVESKTPDGKKFALDGPIDGTDGDKYPARGSPGNKGNRRHRRMAMLSTDRCSA